MRRAQPEPLCSSVLPHWRVAPTACGDLPEDRLRRGRRRHGSPGTAQPRLQVRTWDPPAAAQWGVALLPAFRMLAANNEFVADAVDRRQRSI